MGNGCLGSLEAAAHKELMQIPVGQVPKRNTTAVLP